MKIFISKWFVCSLVLIYCYCFAMAQFDPPELLESGSTNDINFTSCASLRNLNFSSAYDFAWPNRVRYTWKLYRDNNEIGEYIQQTELLSCCNNCSCELPSVNFSDITPISGSYEVRLIADEYFCLPLATDFTCVYNATLYDQYSNIINVTRPDDGAEYSCDLPYDLTVNCAVLSLFHDGGFLPGYSPVFIPPQPATVRAVNNLTANCNISSNGQPVKFIAGNKISLTQGFSSGNNFRAYLDICNDGIIVQKKGNDSNDNAVSTIDTSNTITSQQLANDNNDSQSKIYTPQPQTANNNSDNSNLQSEILITPNPTTGRTVIYFSPEKITTALARLEITDVLGRTVFVKEPFATGVANNIDLSHLQKGIYFLKIYTEDGVRVEKVVIE